MTGELYDSKLYRLHTFVRDTSVIQFNLLVRVIYLHLNEWTELTICLIKSLYT